MNLRTFLRWLAPRRRVSTHLTPAYEIRRCKELRAARERFEAGK